MLNLGGRGAASAECARSGEGTRTAEQHTAAQHGVEFEGRGGGVGAHGGLLVGVDCADAVFAV